jgi:hypothetical protein
VGRLVGAIGCSLTVPFVCGGEEPGRGLELPLCQDPNSFNPFMS